ncbi:BQ5605_C010g05931 [Microbotryum silenes-dioicae]|uniref:BQ5605_C010g05931 protein n=1 Tax=Microbotryum silenes-dioicae TaxID=796604 RepID=A0A2X0NM70_9BASI|nr:BQ5605_C010g05931 [Microbotryum silenes-dioicae]
MRRSPVLSLPEICGSFGFDHIGGRASQMVPAKRIHLVRASTPPITCQVRNTPLSPSSDMSPQGLLSSLPVIDLSSFLEVGVAAGDSHPSAASDSDRTSRQSAVAASIHAACRDYGFFYVTGFDSVISREERQGSLAVARQFFDLPEPIKQRVRIDKGGDGARGWQKLGENVTQYQADHHEGYDLYRPVKRPDATKLLHGHNPWPVEPANFRPTLERWIEKCQIIGMALMQATAFGLGMALDSDEWKHLRASVDESFWVMRCIGYPPLPKDAKGVSCGAHKDYGCYTLLHTDSTPGALQVFLPSEQGASEENGVRGSWIPADPIQDAFVVNIGSMWEIWSAGLYKATIHRVLHKSPNYRVSIPFFFEPNFDAVIKPLPAALKLRDEAAGALKDGPEPTAHADSVIYGEFLRSKVAGNFAP